MQSLSCLSHIKSTENSRPPAPPMATFTHVITDRSGSMGSMNGLQIPMNKKLLDETKELAEKTETPTFVTFTTFDDQVEHLTINKNILDYDVPSEEELHNSLAPRGTTRFVDTVLEAIEEIDTKYLEYKNNLPKKIKALDPKIVRLINCTTDGMDNCSINDANKLKKAMTNFRNNGGEALLLAANMNAELIGKQYGFNSDISLTVHASDPDAIEFAFNSLRSQSQRLTSGGSPLPYTQLQRETSQAVGDFSPTLQPHQLSLSFPDTPLPPLLQRHNNLPYPLFDLDDEDVLETDDEDILLPPPPAISRVRQLRRSNRLNYPLVNMKIKK
jgi:hypothetical protein